jgi:peptide/nickel transport system substrate-binding protein
MMPASTRRTLLGGAASLVATRVASARDENVVRWASAGGVLTWDPHVTTETPSLSGYRHVYETLTGVDPDLTFHPSLATAWKHVGPLTWEFELREGVTFHDGTPFTAADVVFSLKRAHDQPSALTSYTHSIAAARTVDEHKVEITTTHSDLLLPINLRNVAILSQVWAERHGVVAVTRYVDGQAPSLIAANGTGPFIPESYEPGRRTVLIRNPSWWGQYLYPHNIDRIEWTIVPDPMARLQALLDGATDFIQDPPLDALDRIRNTPSLELAETGELRVLLLGLNQGTPELHTSDIKGKNPFKDKRVRRAIYQAIDIEVIRDQVMHGVAIPTGMTITPGVNGYSPELDRRLSYDPNTAKKLLAEAGYGEGFRACCRIEL